MKATGIIRRIDELGRIVIPKEIRRTLGIHDGDPLEIYIDQEGMLILRKYDMRLPLLETVKRLRQDLAEGEPFLEKDDVVTKVGELETLLTDRGGKK